MFDFMLFEWFEFDKMLHLSMNCKNLMIVRHFNQIYVCFIFLNLPSLIRVEKVMVLIMRLFEGLFLNDGAVNTKRNIHCMFV